MGAWHRPLERGFSSRPGAGARPAPGRSSYAFEGQPARFGEAGLGERPAAFRAAPPGADVAVAPGDEAAGQAGGEGPVHGFLPRTAMASVLGPCRRAGADGNPGRGTLLRLGDVDLEDASIEVGAERLC